MSPQWLANHRTFLGATDMAAILRVHPQRSELQVWAEKKHGVFGVETAPMRRGSRMEPFIADMISDEYGLNLIMPDTLREFGTFRHPQYSQLGASPDRLIAEDMRPVEIKSHEWFIRDKYGDAESQDVPPEKWVQVQMQLHMLHFAFPEVDNGFIFPLFGLDDLRRHPIEYAPVACLQMEKTGLEWWARYILGDEEPVAAGLDLGWLSEHFPVDTGVVVDATPEIDAIVDDFRAARAFCADAEENEANLKAQLQQFMGSASVLSTAHGDITWKAAKDSSKTDWQAVARALEAPAKIIEAHTTTVPGSRRFLTPRAWTRE